MKNESTYFGFSIGVFVALAAILVVLSNVIVGSHKLKANDDMSDAAINERIAPVGKLNTGAPIAAVPKAEPVAMAKRSGEQVYNSACMACHASGAAGAPKVGDSAAWAPRIAMGIDGLLASAIKGKGAMPAKGTCSNCSDDELREAIEYMVSKSQ